MKKHSFNIGDIFYSSWGYDQTNIDFYEVTNLIGTTTLELRELARKDIPNNYGFSGKTKPIASQFISQPFKKRINIHGSVKIHDGILARLWSGDPLPYSSYA